MSLMTSDKDANRNSAQVHIRGEPHDVADAKRHVQELVSVQNSGPIRRSEGTNRRPQNFENGGQHNESSVLEIDPMKIGSVIGRGGATIRELQEKFNVHINIGEWINNIAEFYYVLWFENPSFGLICSTSDRNPNYNGKATVTIRGDEKRVQDALAEVKTIVGHEENGWNNHSNSIEPPAPPPTADDTEFEVIDWQAAAKECVCIRPMSPIARSILY